MCTYFVKPYRNHTNESFIEISPTLVLNLLLFSFILIMIDLIQESLILFNKYFNINSFFHKLQKSFKKAEKYKIKIFTKSITICLNFSSLSFQTRCIWLFSYKNFNLNLTLYLIQFLWINIGPSQNFIP